MEIEVAAVDAAKRIVELEAQLEQSKEEHMKLKAKEERANAKCDKLKERLDSEETKWREKWWEAELDRRKLEIDLNVAAVKKGEEAETNRLEISELVGKIDALEKEKAETGNRKVEEKITELVGKIEVLEKEKAERDHEMNKMKSRLQMEYRAKKTREAENRKVEEKITELVGKIEVLEKEKEKREAEIRTGTERIEAEKKRISEKVKALESENRKADSECARKMEVLEREKRKMESDFKANRDRKILEIISSIEDLGKGVEAKDCQAGRELIEKEILVTPPELIEKVILGTPPELIQKEILGTPPTPQNQGEGSCVEKWSGTKKRKSGGRPKWESAFEMLNAFTTNDELCMRSVCALNRKHKSLGSWKNCSSSDKYNTAAFKPIHESMGMALGELLTNGDPEGKMKKSLAKFKRAHPLDLEECRLIAKHHHMELFHIYKNNLDPFFMSSDC